MRREKKKIIFNEKVLQDYYDNYPIEVHIEDLYFDWNEEREKYSIVCVYNIIKSPVMDVIDTEEDYILIDMIFDLLEKIQIPYIHAIDITIGPSNEDFEEMKDNYELIEEIRIILEDAIDEELDKHIDEIKEIYYRAYYLTFCK